MEEKKYLKWYQKFAYGCGDVAGNCGFALLSGFMMLYLSTVAGLNIGIVGTLMMFSKLCDGFTDVFFGTLIDRTKSKMGKARPWMFYAQIGVSVCLFLLFSIPTDFSPAMKYVYFFIFYTAYNAIFYTANNIAYSTLTALITRNSKERVQMGSIRFIFASVTYMVIASLALGLVDTFGGGAKGWRTLALIIAVIAFVINSFSVFMVKELPEEEDVCSDDNKNGSTKVGLLTALKVLVKNKYYILMLIYYLVWYGLGGVTGAVGVFFYQYYIGNASLLGISSMCSSFPMIVTLILNPLLVSKFGSMRKVNLGGFLLYVLASALLIFGALNKNVMLIMAAICLQALGSGPMIGTANVLIAEISTYAFHKEKIHVEGAMYSCTSIGVKVGQGIGAALAGWILALAGFDGSLQVQPAGVIHTIVGLNTVTPLIISIIICMIIYSLKVEEDNRKWEIEHAGKEAI